MTIRVKLFGPEARVAGTREASLQIHGGVATVAAVRAELHHQYPSLANVRFRVAVNHEFAAEDQPVREQDEVAVIGLVSGG